VGTRNHGSGLKTVPMRHSISTGRRPHTSISRPQSRTTTKALTGPQTMKITFAPSLLYPRFRSAFRQKNCAPTVMAKATLAPNRA